MTHMQILQNAIFNFFDMMISYNTHLKSRLSIPLCQLILLPLGRLYIEVDVQLMENK